MACVTVRGPAVADMPALATLTFVLERDSPCRIRKTRKGKCEIRCLAPSEHVCMFVWLRFLMVIVFHWPRAIDELVSLLDECRTALDPPVAVSAPAGTVVVRASSPHVMAPAAVSATSPVALTHAVVEMPATFPAEVAAFSAAALAMLAPPSLTELSSRLVVYRAFGTKMQLAVLQLNFWRFHEAGLRRQLETTLQSRESLTAFSMGWQQASRDNVEVPVAPVAEVPM